MPLIDQWQDYDKDITIAWQKGERGETERAREREREWTVVIIKLAAYLLLFLKSLTIFPNSLMASSSPSPLVAQVPCMNHG